MSVAFSVTLPGSAVSVALAAYSCDTGRDVYEMVAEAENLTLGTFDLMHDGSLFDSDFHSITELGVVEGAKLVLAPREGALVGYKELRTNSNISKARRREIFVDVRDVETTGLEAFRIPTGVEKISFITGGGFGVWFEEVRMNFLVGCMGLVIMDFTGVSTTVIKDGFLSGCVRLKKVTLPIGVEAVGARFLAGCSSLEELDLTPFEGAETLGAGFLMSCKSLKSLDLTPLRRVQSVPSYFMQSCVGLTVLNLAPLSITATGGHFVSDCESLHTLTLPNTLTAVDSYFLSNCPALEALNLTPLANVKTTSNKFLFNCSRLRTVHAAKHSPVASWIQQAHSHVELVYPAGTDPVGNKRGTTCCLIS